MMDPRQQPLKLTLDGIVVTNVVVDTRGKWEALLPPHAVSFGVTVVALDIIGGKATTHVKFGYVILCSGQSNMDMPVVG